MTDNICTTYDPRTDNAKAYQILANQCKVSLEETCKTVYTDQDKVKACVEKPDEYLQDKLPSSFKVLGRTFGYPNINACNIGGCSYVREIGIQNILVSKNKSDNTKPVEKTKSSNDAKPADAFEIQIDASVTNLELFVGKPNFSQELEIDVMCNGITKRIEPKPDITYTIIKKSDSVYEMTYTIKMAGRIFVENETITFSKKPSLEFKIWLWKENDFDSINKIRLVVR